MKRIVIVTRLADRHDPDPNAKHAESTTVVVDDGSLAKVLAQIPDQPGARWHLDIGEPFDEEPHYRTITLEEA